MEDFTKKLSIISLVGLGILIITGVINLFTQLRIINHLEIAGFITFLFPVFVFFFMLLETLTGERKSIFLEGNCAFIFNCPPKLLPAPYSKIMFHYPISSGKKLLHGRGLNKRKNYTTIGAATKARMPIK